MFTVEIRSVRTITIGKGLYDQRIIAENLFRILPPHITKQIRFFREEAIVTDKFKFFPGTGGKRIQLKAGEVSLRMIGRHRDETVQIERARQQYAFRPFQHRERINDILIFVQFCRIQIVLFLPVGEQRTLM